MRHSRGFTLIELLVTFLIIAILLALIGASVPLVGFLFLVFGWIGYLFDTLPRITVDWPNVIWAGIVFLLFTAGLHRFCGWLYAATLDRAGEDSSSRAWPKRWTASLVGGVVTMFIAGIALVGITHQIAWMATSEERLTSSSRVARRTQSINNQKNLALAAQNYSDDENQLPPGATLAPDGTPLYGWPVSLLPGLDMSALHREINKEVPWNHSDNAKLMRLQLGVFNSVGFNKDTQQNAEGYATIHYAANWHVLFPGSRTRMEDITDGAANTLLFGEVAGQFQPWGSPNNLRDPMLGLNKSPSGFGSPWQGITYFAFADGSARGVSDDIDPRVLRALATPRGGEDISPDTD